MAILPPNPTDPLQKTSARTGFAVPAPTGAPATGLSVPAPTASGLPVQTVKPTTPTVAPAAAAPAKPKAPPLPSFAQDMLKKTEEKIAKMMAPAPTAATGAAAGAGAVTPPNPTVVQGDPASEAPQVENQTVIQGDPASEAPQTPIQGDPANETPQQLPPSGITPPAATDAPAVVKQKTEAEQTFADLMTKANEWLNAKEDPASKLAFSRAITQSALVNQEAMNATKAAIAGNPALAGQPAGEALLALRAGQLGMQAADLKGQLAISEARAVSELNRLGFDAVYKLNELRKSDDEKKLSGYGTVLDEMIKGGADEATLNDFFENNIKPLLPNSGAGLTLDQFRNPGTRAQLLSAHQSQTQKLFREAIVRGDDLATIRQLLDAAYTPEQITSIGKDWMKGKSLEEVNTALTAAGYDEVEDLADLIDNEDMLGEAVAINNARTEANKKPYDDEVDDTLQSLTDLGYELTPELEQQVKAYVIASSLPGFDPEDSTPPWKNDATAHLWDSWPLPGQSDFGNATIDDTPSTHAIYARNAALDGAWENYVRTTDADSRMTRKDWYAALAKDLPGVANGADTAAIASWTPPKKKVEAGDRVLAAKEGEIIINDAVDGGTWSDIDWADPNVLEYKRSLPPLADKDVTKALVQAGAAPVVKINGKVYRTIGLDNRGGGEKNDYIRLQDEAGNTVWIRHGTGTVLTTLPGEKAPAATTTTGPRSK